MEVAQVYQILNTVTGEVLGKTDLVQEDLSNVIDIGKEIFNSDMVDNYVKKLVDHIGRVVFVDRPYRGGAPSVLMDGWEYGSVMEKISVDLPEATENESWELEDGQSYDPNIFYAPKVRVKFYDSKTTFEVKMSFAKRQVKSSFSGENQLNAFFSMIYNAIENAITVRNDALIMRTINSMTAYTLASEFADGTYAGKTSGKAVNLLYLYNQMTGTGVPDLTADKAITNPEFIRFAAYTIGMYSDRMTKLSTLFNVGGNARFTPKDLQHIVMLSDFVNATSVFLQSDVYHDNLVQLPKAETVPYWQGSGQSYAFDDISGIDVTIKTDDGNKTVTATGILAVIFDRDALGVTNKERWVNSKFNEAGDFYTNWYKVDAAYFVDPNENFVVFYVA